MHRGAPGDLLGRGLLGGAQREVGLFVLAPLEERAGGVDEEARLALGDGDLAQVDAAGDVDRGSRVPEGDGDVDPVQAGVGGAERGPAQVAVYAEALRRRPSASVSSSWAVPRLLVLGGGDRAAQQERPVDRQRLGSVGRAHPGRAWRRGCWPCRSPPRGACRSSGCG